MMLAIISVCYVCVMTRLVIGLLNQQKNINTKAPSTGPMCKDKACYSFFIALTLHLSLKGPSVIMHLNT